VPLGSAKPASGKPRQGLDNSRCRRRPARTRGAGQNACRTSRMESGAQIDGKCYVRIVRSQVWRASPTPRTFLERR